MRLPSAYEWLSNEPGPKILVEALRLYGTHETLGAGDNPIILGWAREIGIASVFVHDEQAWCALLLAVCAKRAGYEPPFGVKSLRALEWATWGNPVDVPSLGDVLSFKRFDSKHRLIGGHAGLYVAEDPGYYHVYGGNQSDQVSIVRKPKASLHAARRSPFKIGPPPNIRRVFMTATGPVSTNEA